MFYQISRTLEALVRPIPSHSNSLGNNAEKDTAGCRALTRKYIVTGGNNTGESGRVTARTLRKSGKGFGKTTP